MIWVARLKDGSIIGEYESGVETKLTDIDSSLIDSIKITETGNDMFLPFSGDSGLMRFVNLDPVKEVQDGQKISFIYDKNLKSFKMDSDSIKFYEDHIQKDTRVYNFIAFDQSGRFNVNGEVFFTGLEFDGKMVDFINTPPYKDIIHFKRGANDFKMIREEGKTAIPIKQTEKTFSYSLGYTHTHIVDDYVFDLRLELIYDLEQRCIRLDFMISSNKTMKCAIYLVFAGKKSRLPVTLTENQLMQTKRILTLI